LNVISNLATPIKVLLLIIIFAVVWLFTNKQEQSVDTDNVSTIDRSIDYAMTNFKMTVMDESGRPARVIEGAELSHYPDDDSTHINDAVAYFLAPDKDTWLVKSNHAFTQGKGENIDLNGNVVITRQSNNEIELLSEQLTLDTVNNTAYTDQPVTIRSPYGDTESVGLHAVLQDETINLHSRVRGQYDAPTTD
jgi:lipopolysaccharide export system protein LptC